MLIELKKKVEYPGYTEYVNKRKNVIGSWANVRLVKQQYIIEGKDLVESTTKNRFPMP